MSNKFHFCLTFWRRVNLIKLFLEPKFSFSVEVCQVKKEEKKKNEIGYV